MIELRNFSIGHRGKNLLKDVDAKFNQGELTALIGRNGSGKSTLLRAMAGISHNFSGEIKISPDGALSKTIAYVATSRIGLPGLTCRELVALGRSPWTGWTGRLSSRDNEIIDSALALTGMTDFADRAVDTVSDGEYQRVMIARALAQTTAVILLDEPTSFLDIPNRRQLVEMLRRIAHEGDKCIIYSSHELELAMQLADTIAVIDNPRLLVETPSTLDESGLLRRLFGIE